MEAVAGQAGKLQHTSNLYYTLPCEELAEACGTISNEILSRLGKRLPRVWL